MNGHIWKILISDNLDSPRAIIVDYKSGYMFWTDWGRNPNIARAGMDGTDAKTIITTNLMWPNGVTIDQKTQRIIWGDADTEVKCE